jgi:sortase A
VPGPYRALGRIAIPAIGLDVAYGEGVFEKTLVRGPGHWPGTPMPGRLGNAVISGHRNTHTQPFKELDRLRPGDSIIVEDEQGRATTFAVTGTTIVPEADYKDFVLGQPEDADGRELTLFACHPEGNPIFRIVIKATA